MLQHYYEVMEGQVSEEILIEMNWKENFSTVNGEIQLYCKPGDLKKVWDGDAWHGLESARHPSSKAISGKGKEAESNPTRNE